ncbi:MAG: dockerin type I repeat-containing protein [Oscillospiraceae bacterium]|nr:dockerin type I repeat-containing protein [Oscillospiraceae bacterium]
MKKRMRLAAMLAGAVMLCGTISTVPVSALWWWGNAASEEFQDMTLLDDKGMFKWIGYGGVPGTPRDYQVYTQHYSQDVEAEVTYADTGETKIETTHYEEDRLYVVMPRSNILRMVLRSDLDETETKRKAVTILRKYYPEMLVDANSYGFPASFHKCAPCTYELCDRSETAGSSEISAAIMKDMAQAGLITEFYSWGQTADYQQVGNTYPTAYYPTSHKWNSSYTAVEDVTYDWDAVEAWVQEHHPECEFICVTPDDTETAKKIGQYDLERNKVFFNDNLEQMYAVIPPDGTAFPEHFAIAAELYEQFGLAAEWLCPESAASPMNGQNALAAAGDVNLDCSIDVSDAVLIARFAAEDREATMTDQGRQNADVTHDNNVDSQDAAKILQYIAKQIRLEDLAK